MITYNILAGTTDVSVILRIFDSTDGTPETGVVFNTAGLDLQYRRELADNVAITEASLAALTTAHTDGGFLAVGNGFYRLDLPDAACASGARAVLVHGTVTGMVIIGCYINLTPVPIDVRQWLGTPAATPTVAGVPEVDMTHLVGVAQSATDLKDFADDGYDPSTNKVQGVVLTDTVTTYTGNTPQTGDSFARIGATGSGLTTLATQASVNALPTAAVNADAVWDEDATGHQTQGTFGQAIGDPVADTDTIWGLANTNLDAAVSTRATPAQVNTEVLDVVTVDTFAELAAVPAATSTLKDKINWLFALARGKLTQTTTTQTLRNDADAANIATSTVSDDGTVATRNKWA